MPYTLDTPGLPLPTPGRIRWTRQQCREIASAGILTERYELVEGEIISKIGQNRPHATVIALLNRPLSDLFGAEYLQIQGPIDVAARDNPTSEPEPDVVVVDRPMTAYGVHNPGPQDIRLVVEVADTSVQFDLTVKARLYSRAGIADYWVVDIPARRIWIHRAPGMDEYDEVLTYESDELVSPLAQSQTQILVHDLLPPM